MTNTIGGKKTMMIEDNAEPMNDEWKLDGVEIQFCNWGKNAGKYEGRIRFSNGECESFSFKIQPGMAQKYIDLMAKDIVINACNLGDRLVKSLGLADEDAGDLEEDDTQD